MKDDSKFFLSIFIIFTGFMIFVLTLLNKQKEFFHLMTSYYVLFVLFGLLLGIAGSSLMLAWHVKNRRPFEDTFTRTKYPSEFAIGTLLVFSGLTFYFFYSSKSWAIVQTSLAISAFGIFILLLGLRSYLKEVIFSQKEAQHS